MNMEKKDKIDVENINNNNKKNKKDVKNINNNDKKNKKDNIETLNIINLDYVNNRIDKEFCDNTVNELKDTYLINKYKECKSVKNEIEKLNLILEKYNIETNKKKLIINDYILNLIPAGTKGVIRGNKFNNIVKKIINNLKLNNERFEIYFEKQCLICITTEIPDWYILEKTTNKVIVGMNQLDLWAGGQQINRGFKYLIDNKNNTENSKLLCVVCNKIKFNSNKNKAYKLFETGYLNNTLCYIKNIENIINKFFN
jgi:hypothetical protein